MNEIVNRFSLARDKFIFEMHLVLTYNACGPFPKNRKNTKV